MKERQNGHGGYKEGNGNGKVLLALRTGKVATRARIFQAITQVETRVKQNSLREGRIGLEQMYSSSQCQNHLIVIDASFLGCRGRGCTVPSCHLIFFMIKTPICIEVGILPEILLFCHLMGWSLRGICCSHPPWHAGFSAPSVSFSDSSSLPEIGPK